MTYAKQSGRQCPEYLVARVQASDINAVGDSTGATLTITVGDLPISCIPLSPQVAIDTSFDGTAVINVGLTGDADALATGANITEAAPGMYTGTGAEVGQLQSTAKEVKISVSSTTTITTGDLRIIVPYLIDGRATSVYGDD